MPAWNAVKLPAGVSDETAAAALLKGLTARYLLKATYPVKRGQTILLHSAAGGVGLIAGQWAKHLGVRVIGTVGSDDKIALAKANGCDVVLNVRTEDWVKRVRELTDGAGVPVVYDFDRQRHLHELARLPPGARDAGLFREFVGRGPAVRPVDPEREGVPLPDAADARELYAQCRRVEGDLR